MCGRGETARHGAAGAAGVPAFSHLPRHALLLCGAAIFTSKLARATTLLMKYEACSCEFWKLQSRPAVAGGRGRGLPKVVLNACGLLKCLASSAGTCSQRDRPGQVSAGRGGAARSSGHGAGQSKGGARLTVGGREIGALQVLVAKVAALHVRLAILLGSARPKLATRLVLELVEFR